MLAVSFLFGNKLFSEAKDINDNYSLFAVFRNYFHSINFF